MKRTYGTNLNKTGLEKRIDRGTRTEEKTESRFDEFSDDSVKDNVSEKMPADQLSFEYSSGTAWRGSSGRELSGRATEVLGDVQKQMMLQAPLSMVRKTEVGQGAVEIRKDLRQAAAFGKGVTGGVSLVDSLVETSVHLGGNALKTIGFGAGSAGRYLRGEDISSDSIQGKLEQAAQPPRRLHLVSFSRDKTQARLEQLNERFAADPLSENIRGAFTDRYWKEEKVLIRGKVIATRDIDLLKVSREIQALSGKVKQKLATPEEMRRLESLKELQAIGVSRQFQIKTGKSMRNIKRGVSSAAAIAVSADPGENAAAEAGQYILRSGVFVRASGKALISTGKVGLKVGEQAAEIPGIRHVRRNAAAGARDLADSVGHAVASAGTKTGKAVIQAGRASEKMVLTGLGRDYNRYHREREKYLQKLQKKLQDGTRGTISAVHGGIYARVSESKAGRAAGKLGGEVTSAADRVSGPARFVFNKVTYAKLNGTGMMKRITRPAGRVRGMMLRTGGLIGVIKTQVILILSFSLLIIVLFTLVGTFFIGTQMVFDTGSENLQQYVDYAVSVSEDWYAGKLEDSTNEVDGWPESLQSLYDKGENEKERYRIITTSYLDDQGEQVDANDNIKELLSMVSVKTLNTWPDSWDLVVLPWGKDKWTVSELKTLIRCLYQATHHWSADEKGPYPYYREMNEKRQKLLRPAARGAYQQMYFFGDYEERTLLGDAEGEACEGPREFWCTEDTLPEHASEYRMEMTGSYSGRGGCEVDYRGFGNYDAAADVLTLTEGALHDGTTVISDAHEKVWATEDMKRRYALARQYAADPSVDGAGDELKKRHEDAFGVQDPPPGCTDYEQVDTGRTVHEHVTQDSPAPGCQNYETIFAGYCHETVMDGPAFGCGSYEVETSYGLPVYGLTDGWGQDVWYWWNETAGRYEASVDGRIFFLNAPMYRFYTGKDYIHYRYDGLYSRYVPNDTTYRCREEAYRYICRDRLYNYICREKTAYCDGNHRQYVTIYYCPGHKEYWCSENHYDLDVRIRVSHIPAALQEDVETPYHYKRKAVAVGDYPEGFDKLKEDGDSDFYWDAENIQQAEFLSGNSWKEIYGEVTGAEDVDVELDEATIDHYREYYDLRHIAAWKRGVPYSPDGGIAEIAGRKWFYDEGRSVYVLVKRSGDSYEVLRQSDVSPVGISEAGRRVMEQALMAVGRIPWQESKGFRADGQLEDYGWEEDLDGVRCVVKGLDSGEFVSWTFRTAGYEISSRGDGVKEIWEATEKIGNRSTIEEGDLKPGDLGFINSYDDRKNPAVAMQTEDEVEPFNTIGIYLGTNDKDQKIWIQCSRTNGTVSVTTTNAFNYFRRAASI